MATLRSPKGGRSRPSGPALPAVLLALSALALGIAPLGPARAAEVDQLLPVAQARDTLVVIQGEEVERTHAKFLASLRDRAGRHGGRVDVRSAASVSGKGSFRLREWDKWAYDSLVLLAPSLAEIGGEDASGLVTAFVESGRPAFVAGSEEMSGEVRALAKACGVAFHDATDERTGRNALVLDFFRGSGGDGGVIEATNYADDGGSVLSDEARSRPLLFRGVGAHVDPKSGLAFAAVAAHPTSFCPTKKGFLSKKESNLRAFTGTDVSLVSLVQARNNARAAFTGSLAMLSDEYMTPRTSNLKFAEDVTDWVLGYKSLLRYTHTHTHTHSCSHTLTHTHTHTHRWGSIEHSLVRGKGERGETKDVYRIKDELAVSLRVEEWSAALQKWTPFGADDIQLEFTMLDPHVRKTFSKDAEVSPAFVPQVCVCVR